jgi:uncharacterized membrane protein
MKIVKNNFCELLRNKRLITLSVFFLLFGQFIVQYKEVTWPKLYLIIAMFFFVLLFSFSRLNEGTKIPKNAFALILIIGTLNALILPIKQNLDENTHFYHALQIADGKIRNQTNELKFLDISPDFLNITKLPNRAYGDSSTTNLYSKEFWQLKHQPSTYTEELLDVKGFNNPVYIPSALGIAIGRVVSNKVAVSYYLGRLFNVLSYAILSYLAIKISKKYKIQLFIIATLPYAIWISSGFTYDYLYYGLILLILAQLTNFLGNENYLTLKRASLYCLTCLGLVFCKAPTILLIGLPFFLPNRCYKNKSDRFKLFWIIGAFLALGCLWIMQNSLFDLFLPHSQMMETINNGSDAQDTLGYFLNHPIYTVGVIIRNIFDMLPTIFYSIQSPLPFTKNIGPLNIINIIVTLFLIFLATLQIKIKMNKLFTVATITIFLVITIGIIIAIAGDPRVFHVGDLHVAGVQGRYHFYILAFLPLLLAPLIQSKASPVNSISENYSDSRLAVLVMKLVFLVIVLNSSVAIYSYL